MENCVAYLREPNPNLHIWSDASQTGAGAHSSRGENFQREWSKEELNLELSINLLELRAAKEALLKFAQPGDTICLHMDNQVACAYILKQGWTKSPILCQEALELWQKMEQRGVFLLPPPLDPHRKKYQSRLSVKAQNRDMGIGTGPEGVQLDCPKIGSFSHSGRFCIPKSTQTSPLSHLGAGSLVSGQGCLSLQVGQNELHFPPCPPDSQNFEKNSEGGVGCHSHLHNPCGGS